MSADNATFIRKIGHRQWVVYQSMMSDVEESRLPKPGSWNHGGVHETYAQALVAAHALDDEEYTEYGVVHLSRPGVGES